MASAWIIWKLVTQITGWFEAGCFLRIPDFFGRISEKNRAPGGAFFDFNLELLIEKLYI